MNVRILVCGVAAALALGCTEYQFADNLRCSSQGTCPPGQFCDVDVCRIDLAACGNGTSDIGELCDDGNRQSGDGCRADCLLVEACGDAVENDGEGCDDGNTVGGDGCAADCSKLEVCGDSIHDDGEVCDDGNVQSNDGCADDCKRVEPAISFSADATSATEGDAAVTIPVVLSAVSDVEVRVAYAFTGGSATQGVDYVGSGGMLTFAPGETQKLVTLSITLDSDQEPAETIDLMLSSPLAGKLGAITTHRVTIASVALRTLAFANPTTSSSEGTPASVDVSLDAVSPFPVTVQFTLSGTAMGTDDYTLTPYTVTFDPGVMTQQIPLGIVADMLDEDPETVILTLQNPTNATIGTVPSCTHTITDDDPAPNVSFALAASSHPEASGTVMVDVTLSTESGRTVMVPFTVQDGSATSPADYSVSTTSPLAFAPGTTTQKIEVSIAADSAVDGNEETFQLMLGTPSNGTATLVSPSAHTLSIVDDERTCLGADPYVVCVPTPATAKVLPASINTDSSADCQTMQPLGWIDNGQPAVCVVAATSITMNAPTVVTGSRPLVLFADDSITVSQLIDVASARNGKTGPGAPWSACSPFPFATPELSGGGAGGTFKSLGGFGGTGGGGTMPSPPAPSAASTVLRAGCNGQITSTSNPGSRGGGAVYLVARNTISMTATGIIDASGAGGLGGLVSKGGSGGGSGGMIKLFAATFNAVAGAKLVANGGGGGGGGSMPNPGDPGDDPSPSSPNTPALGGNGASGSPGGGDGFAGTTQAQGGGSTVEVERGGGGGGGGGGYVESNRPLTNVTISAGAVN